MRKNVLRAALLLFLLLSVEVVLYVCFTATKFISKDTFYIFFSSKDECLGVLEKNINSFDEYKVNYFDSIKGWVNSRGKVFYGEDCAGSWSASYDVNGARNTGLGDVHEPYAIVCVGDSFTHGNGVDDVQAYPSELARLTKNRVGNFGVGGYDVIQSVLQYNDVLEKSDGVKIGVLGILYEGGRRNLNSFRPVMTNSAGDVYYFKPHYKEKKIAHNVLGERSSIETLRSLISESFVSDYWAKPEFKFPYTISFLKSCATPSVVFAVRQKINHILGIPTYFYDFGHEDILGSLRYSISEFMMTSDRHGVYPVVVFIPANLKDRTSPDSFVKELAAIYPAGMFLNFGNSNVEWGRYMKKAGCHPTDYGYFEIAKFVATQLENKQLVK